MELIDALEHADVPHAKAVAKGVLEGLWHFTARYAPAGNVGRFGERAIARACGWDGNAAELVSMLVSTGWLDASDTHRLVVHDWPEHCEDAVHMAMARKGERFADGSIPKLTRFREDERKAIGKRYAVDLSARHAHVCAHDNHTPCADARTESTLPRLSPALAPPSPEENSTSPTAVGGHVNGFSLEPEPDPPPDPACSAFPAVWQAFALYGRFLEKDPPAEGHLARIRALLRKGRTVDDLVHAVHGFAWKHQRPGRDFDPEKHRTPNTIFRPGNIDEYLEQWKASQLAGRNPPFMPEAR